MDNQLAISKSTFEDLIASRKMTYHEFVDLARKDGDVITFRSLDDVRKVADKLDVPVSHLFDEDDLDDGVKICRGLEGFQRTETRNGEEYYTYTHLATSKTAPELMALHLTAHNDKEEKVTLNAGHGAKEFVYILRGNIKMHWKNGISQRSTLLETGDSVYLMPGIPHSFIAEQGDAELLAVNF